MSTHKPLRAEIGAYFNTFAGGPNHVDYFATFATPDEADAFAAAFPKSLRLHRSTLTYCYDEPDGTRKPIEHTVRLYAVLVPTGNNGGVNETGVKRYRRLMLGLDRLGMTPEWLTRAGNAYATREDFETAIS